MRYRTVFTIYGIGAIILIISLSSLPGCMLMHVPKDNPAPPYLNQRPDAIEVTPSDYLRDLEARYYE